MKKLGIFLITLALLLTMVTVPALAEDDESLKSFNSYMASARELAAEADHIIGPDDIDTIQKYNMTIIQPGETIAIVPDAGYNPNGIQGGIGAFGFTIIQLNDPEVHTEYLKEGSKPEKTTLTEVSKKTMSFPLGAYELEGATSVTYVSLYKNETGYPIVVRGHHGASVRNIWTKTSEEKYAGWAKEGFVTKRQAGGTVYYAPIFWFVEPTYELEIAQETSGGVAYEWNTDTPVTSLTVYMDGEDHEYELQNPIVPGWSFEKWERTENTFAFPIHEGGEIKDGKTTFTFNMLATMRKGSEMDPKYFVSSGKLRARFFTDGNTVIYHAGEGKLEGRETYVVDAGRNDSFTLNLNDYIPVRENTTFLGWGTDEEDPAGTLLKDATAENHKDWFKGKDRVMDVYAAWGYTVSFDANGGTGTMEDITVPEGEKLTLPENGFTAAKDQFFAKWDAGAPGDEIEVTKDMTIKATWSDHPLIPVGKSGWVQLNSGDWAYGDADGNAVTGLQTIGGAKYIFDPKGNMVTGWAEVDGKWYYAEASGALCTGWFLDGTTWYFFNDSGEMATGWIYDGSNWYYMKASGAMATGWLEDGGSWYYIKPSGTMLTGWLEDGGTWYYMKSSGAMATGWIQDGGAWYYFDGSGAMQTGWVQAGGRWYHFKSSGAMNTGWFEDKEAENRLPAGQKRAIWYWFDNDGAMATGWKEISGQWEMFADSGEWLYTWQGN